MSPCDINFRHILTVLINCEIRPHCLFRDLSGNKLTEIPTSMLSYCDHLIALQVNFESLFDKSALFDSLIPFSPNAFSPQELLFHVGL